MTLFQYKLIRLSSGQPSLLKIECDALTAEDVHTLCYLMSELVKPFREAISVPSGGDKFARVLNTRYATRDPAHPVLIVDDVLTTGASMERVRAQHPGASGVVAFSRGELPSWVQAVFQLSPALRDI